MNELKILAMLLEDASSLIDYILDQRNTLLKVTGKRKRVTRHTSSMENRSVLEEIWKQDGILEEHLIELSRSYHRLHSQDRSL